jgi:hypothetical protein
MATRTEIIALAGTVSPRHSHCLHYAGNKNDGVTGDLWQSFCGMLGRVDGFDQDEAADEGEE